MWLPNNATLRWSVKPVAVSVSSEEEESKNLAAIAVSPPMIRPSFSLSPLPLLLLPSVCDFGAATTTMRLLRHDNGDCQVRLIPRILL
jgi:hypothetical protein